MKVLVTGATGFIGSALVPMLRERGHDVWEMVRYVAGGRYDYYARDRVVFADLRDSAEVRMAVMKVRPDVVVHLAAMSAVSYSFLHPEEVNDVGYMGTVRVANAVKEIGGCSLVFASSSEVYGRGKYVLPLTEDSPIGGTSPYAAAKIASEEYLRVLVSTGDLGAVIMRSFNTIGRATVRNSHFVVERAICQALEDGRINLHDSRPVRDFMFRTDHARGYVAILDMLASNPQAVYGQTFNLCTGDAWSIGDMARYVGEQVSELCDMQVTVSFTEVPDRPLDIPILQGSAQRAQDVLGWRPAYTIRTGIQCAVREWAKVLQSA